MTGKVHIGISGWVYPHWRNNFYPKGLKQKEELAYASNQVQSIEINGTFYRLQKPKSFAAWAATVPSDFRFAIKGNRYITHRRRLKEVDEPMANFAASGILALGEKLGPFLWQLPPNLSFKDGRYAEFCAGLPQDFKSLRSLATGHTDRLGEDSLTESSLPDSYPVRHAIEVRHDSFLCDEFIQILREHNIALVLGNSGEHCQYVEDLTADFVYVRMHGQAADQESGYAEEDLQTFAKTIKAWQAGEEIDKSPRIGSKHPLKQRDVYVYFDNDAKAYAPRDAMRLIETLKK